MTASYQSLPTWKQPLACFKSITTIYYNIRVTQIRRSNPTKSIDLARTNRKKIVIELTDAIGGAAEEALDTSEKRSSRFATAVNWLLEQLRRLPRCRCRTAPEGKLERREMVTGVFAVQ